MWGYETVDHENMVQDQCHAKRLILRGNTSHDALFPQRHLVYHVWFWPQQLYILSFLEIHSEVKNSPSALVWLVAYTTA